MAITIGRFIFEGPFWSTDQLESRSGVYAVLSQPSNGYTVVDVGESAQVRERVRSHERERCWRANAAGGLTFAAHYTPGMQQPGRMEIEQELRRQYRPPCGER